ncbi:MAG: winged helix-turn-helix domain-containing protein, partial [Paracoccaceae bacterium]|nr:winged helix-turn-helix domain-containing protein [Paracoccaceae bacterium]
MEKLQVNQWLGRHFFNFDNLELRTEDGQLVPLRAKSAEVLAELVENRGNLVTKANMMERVWADTFVTDDSLVQCISDIRKALGEDGRYLVTVPKRGYRLEIEAVASPPAEQAKVEPSARSQKIYTLIVAISVAIVGVFAWNQWGREPVALDRQKTIAVLPFQNAGGDPDQLYLSNGVAEDLITALSQISDLRVVARGASFAYSADQGDVRDIAKTLEADVVLEGSIRQVADG